MKKCLRKTDLFVGGAIVTWIFETAGANEPLLEALKEVGIKYKIIEKDGI
ncbi:hypothetical protein HMPREF9374_3668 [Desmospora sp. 8437]|nr:hypothetical protein HMPREF9374_3668 [Desmospora sp. 8437]